MAPLPVSLLFANFLLFQCAGFIFVVVALFCFVFLAASLPVTKSGRKKKKSQQKCIICFLLFICTDNNRLASISVITFRIVISLFSFSVTFGVKPITNSPQCFEDKTAVITLEEHDTHIISLTMYDVTSCICPLLLILNLYSPSAT